MSFFFKCVSCGTAQPAKIDQLACDSCGSVMDVAYDDPADGHAPRLPLARPSERMSLGEGITPLVAMPSIARSLGIKRLWAKLEMMAPTGSFKDRGSAVLVSAALEAGVREFVEDSSGNAGASLSAYAAAAGITAHVFFPESAAQGKVDQIGIFGATLHPTSGPRQAATDAAVSYFADNSFPYLSHNLSPYFLEGMKSFAYEVVGSDAVSATDIVVPVGNGSLLIGMFKGFEELSASGRITVSPRQHAVQADAVKPLVAALNDQEWAFDADLKTVASGISVSHPPRLQQCIDVVRLSDGSGIAVDDVAMLQWQKRLASEVGIFCEATSAAAFAGLEALVATGVINEEAQVLIPITGSGLKEPLTLD
jgi:threonine synthase